MEGVTEKIECDTNPLTNWSSNVNVLSTLTGKVGASLLAAVVILGVSATSLQAEDRVPGFKYTEEKGEGILELKRVTTHNKDGKLIAKAIHYRDGRVARKTFREDGTLAFEHENYGNGQTREHIEYDATGKTVTKRQTYRFDGSMDWEAERKPDGHTLRKDYYADGKLRSTRELFEKNGFSQISYRKDGSKWSGKERKSGQTGRGDDLYFAKDGKSLRRTTDGTKMTVVVYDKNGAELYTQTWLSGIARYQLSSVKEPTTGGGWRVINLQGGSITSVDYYKAAGTLDKSEQPSSLSTPVDAARLQELNPSDDPTIPIFRQLR